MSTSQRYLKHYELQQIICSDTLSQTWKAFDTIQHRYVTIRILRSNPQTISQKLQQGQHLATLKHPYIAQILDVQAIQNPDSPFEELFLVLDATEDQTLADFIEVGSRRGDLTPPTEFVRLLAPIASAMDYLHQQRVVHGDIRPANILLSKRATTTMIGEPRLISFNGMDLSQLSSLSPREVAYIAPEVAQGHKASEHSDIYSLGIILYELCTGTLPFHSDTASDMLMQHIHAAPPSPSLVNPHILPDLTVIIMRCLSKDPAMRFVKASAVIVALTHALHIPIHQIVSQSGSWVGLTMNPGVSTQTVQSLDTQNSPTYLSPLPQSVSSSNTATGPTFQVNNTPFLTPALTPAVTPLPSDNTVAASATTRTSLPPTVASSQQKTQAPSTPVVDPGFPGKKRTKRRLFTFLIPLLLLLLLISGLGAFLIYTHLPDYGQTPVVGHAFFVSSGLLSQNSNQGIADRLQIDLQNIGEPQPDKSYYAWLLADTNNIPETLPILLGKMPLDKGHISYAYPGTLQNSNLLATYSRFLITEEDSNATPSNPSPDPTTWRYYAKFSSTPIASEPSHYSVLDHLRHLLAQDPKLKAAGLTGGLDLWLFRNTLKVLEWSGSARDVYQSGDYNLVRRQLARILYYLDGNQYIGRENLPADLSGNNLVDPTIARVALLEFDVEHQSPPGYLKHIGSHLLSITQAPEASAEQKAQAIQINKSINNVQSWLQAVHDDAAQLVHMSDQQLQQPEALSKLDHMFTQVNYAFAGQADPRTNQIRGGVSQIHYNIQRLATFDITRCTLNGNTCK